MHLERVENLAPLFLVSWTNRYGTKQQMVSLLGETQHVLGVALAPEGQRWLSPGWEHLTSSLRPIAWLADRYPELYGEGEPRRSMAQFDMLLCIRMGLIDDRAAAFFALAGAASEEFAMRLHSDHALRARAASAMGVSSEVFDATAADALRKAQGFQGGFTTSPTEVAEVLVNGRR